MTLGKWLTSCGFWANQLPQVTDLGSIAFFFFLECRASVESRPPLHPRLLACSGLELSSLAVFARHTESKPLSCPAVNVFPFSRRVISSRDAAEPKRLC